MVMAHPLGSDTSSQVQGYAAVKKVGVPDFCQISVAPIHSPSLLAKAGYGYKAAFRLHLLIKRKKMINL